MKILKLVIAIRISKEMWISNNKMVKKNSNFIVLLRMLNLHFLPSKGISHFITQNELNDLVLDLGLSIQETELLDSRFE